MATVHLWLTWQPPEPPSNDTMRSLQQLEQPESRNNPGPRTDEQSRPMREHYSAIKKEDEVLTQAQCG